MVEKHKEDSHLVTRFLFPIVHSGLEFPWNMFGKEVWALLSRVAAQRGTKPIRFTVARYALLNPPRFKI